MRINRHTDYSGFSIDNWTSRENDSHRAVAKRHFTATNRKEKESIESMHGVRYTTLLELEYLDIIRSSCIDPMHNLFLGTSKHMMEVWRENGLIDNSKLSLLQAKVNSFIVPHNIGRIPRKIEGRFAGFKADEWKNWTLIFSVFCLESILPKAHMSVWKLFVKACYLLCQQTLPKDHAKQAHDLLVQFNKEAEKLYGPEVCTMNMHLHCHLLQSIHDFGPIYSFWCFPYERLIGVLGSYSTNHHTIVSQIMRKFCMANVYSVDTLVQVLSAQLDDAVCADTKVVLECICGKTPSNVHLSMAECCDPIASVFSSPLTCKFYNSSFCLHKPMYEGFYNSEEMESLSFMYSYLYGTVSSIRIRHIYHSASDVSKGLHHFTSVKSLTQKSPYLYANWFRSGGTTQATSNCLLFLERP